VDGAVVMDDLFESSAMLAFDAKLRSKWQSGPQCIAIERIRQLLTHRNDKRQPNSLAPMSVDYERTSHYVAAALSRKSNRLNRTGSMENHRAHLAHELSHYW